MPRKVLGISLMELIMRRHTSKWGSVKGKGKAKQFKAREFRCNCSHCKPPKDPHPQRAEGRREIMNQMPDQE
jgi:hypothetical protein